jgi:hypothetical protein
LVTNVSFLSREKGEAEDAGDYLSKKEGIYESSRTFKECVKQPPAAPQGDDYTGVLKVVMRKIENFSHHHLQNTCERGLFSYENNPGWLIRS